MSDFERVELASMPRFEWDEDKCEATVRKHRIDFRDADAIFDTPFLWPYRPARARDDAYTIITARRAGNNEQRAYYQSLA